MEKNLTTGSVFKNIIAFSLPYLLSYFLQTLYGLADLFIIGQYEGVASTTAVSIGSQVMHMLTVMIVGLAMGATVSIGRAVGGGDRRRAAACIGNTITLFMGLSVLLTIVLLWLRRDIVAVMSTPAQAVGGTVDYLTVCFIGIPFITAYNIISSILRGMGDSKSPMYFILVACVANIGLDYLFMGAMHLGPIGAALGTTLSQAVSVVVALVVILRQKAGITPAHADLKPRCAVMGELLRIGVPIALQDGLIQVAFIIITIIANRRGLNDAAAVGIVEKIISFLFLVPSSMLSTVSALGAQNIGAGEAGAGPCHAGLCNPYYGRVWRGYRPADAIFCGTGGRALYRCEPDGWPGGDTAGGTVPARLCVGLLVCGDSFQLQWVFLCLRAFWAIFPAQYSGHYAGAHSGSLLYLYPFCGYAVSDGTGHGGGVAAFCADLCHRLSYHHPP